MHILLSYKYVNIYTYIDIKHRKHKSKLQILIVSYIFRAFYSLQTTFRFIHVNLVS